MQGERDSAKWEGEGWWVKFSQGGWAVDEIQLGEGAVSEIQLRGTGPPGSTLNEALWACFGRELFQRDTIILADKILIPHPC